MMQSLSKSADRLNDLLKGEIAAVETYSQAIDKIKDQSLCSELREVQGCHADRALLLHDKVSSLGREPAKGSGMWGALANMLEGSAKLFGEKAAIGMLEEQEDKELADYRKLSKEAEPALQPFLQNLLQRQEGTHSKMSNLKHRLQ